MWSCSSLRGVCASTPTWDTAGALLLHLETSANRPGWLRGKLERGQASLAGMRSERLSDYHAHLLPSVRHRLIPRLLPLTSMHPRKGNVSVISFPKLQTVLSSFGVASARILGWTLQKSNAQYAGRRRTSCIRRLAAFARGLFRKQRYRTDGGTERC